MEPAEEAQKQRVPDISQTGKNKGQMCFQLDNILHLICSQDKKKDFVLEDLRDYDTDTFQLFPFPSLCICII